MKTRLAEKRIVEEREYSLKVQVLLGIGLSVKINAIFKGCIIKY
ncbi:hypothetical protein FUAG_02616 [Fusobacterium ulcerans ATCC 49185]|uniref:Uncharacterized protein n=1 Tax=Fusobacterium ulcerans TaxID=861 RepID=A0AAX2JFP5_9FUSO|nr:hypothetical protein [Fusobacterium ulcerans]EFS27101.1 hypothetical protein FUAG_02616 [Fusobacterium ulcerans ATCC 49185]SQJ15928.1 Uncharacterised protein [Fusobacterium ulcerans]